jgi:hypothetical protein
LLDLEDDGFFCGDRDPDLDDRRDGVSSSLVVDVVFFDFFEDFPKKFIEE